MHTGEDGLPVYDFLCPCVEQADVVRCEPQGYRYGVLTAQWYLPIQYGLYGTDYGRISRQGQ